jgi:hypothetical protein
MRPLLLTVVILAFTALAVSGQDQKSWTELTKRDAEKLLTDSPWSRSQVDTDVSELFYSPTKPGTSSIGKSQATVGKITDQQSINNNRSDEGAKNEAVSVNYHIRLFSARPVREAIARLLSIVTSGHLLSLPFRSIQMTDALWGRCCRHSRALRPTHYETRLTSKEKMESGYI